jgi:hypothetical protein
VRYSARTLPVGHSPPRALSMRGLCLVELGDEVVGQANAPRRARRDDASIEPTMVALLGDDNVPCAQGSPSMSIVLADLLLCGCLAVFVSGTMILAANLPG